MATPRKGAPIERICSSIAVLQAIGMKEPPRREVARIADYHEHDQEFQKALTLAIELGFVQCRPSNNNLRLSHAGKHSVHLVPPAKDNAEMLLRLHLVLRKKKAPSMASKILEILSDGQIHTLESVACQINSSPKYHTTTQFKHSVSAISALKVLERPVKGIHGSIVLRDVALPGGRTGGRHRVFVTSSF